MKIFIKNCGIEIISQNPNSHVLIEDSYESYLKTGRALKNDGTMQSLTEFKTYYKIPVVEGEVFYYGAISGSAGAPYASYVFYDANGDVVSYGPYNAYVYKCFPQAGFVSFMLPNSDDRNLVKFYTPNLNYETINSDYYLIIRHTLKSDGTTQYAGSGNVIRRVPVSQGDTIIFSTNAANLSTGYAAWVIENSDKTAVLSYGTQAATEKEITMTENGYISVYMANSTELFNAFVDVLAE